MSEPRGRFSGAALRGAVIAAGGLGLLALLVFAAGARVEAATFGLAIAGVALVFALRGLYAVAYALASPLPEAPAAAMTLRSRGELLDERRRLLRALKELDFDRGMGKLSQADYEAVAATYKMRAIEVMRALEGTADLHPELRALLAARGAVQASAPAAGTTTSEAVVAVNVCPKCQTENDGDARFCKRCGAELVA
jgi:ribosomal protein L40E